MIVGTAGYRENKPVTAWQVLPSVLGPEAGPVDLRFRGPDGREHTGFQLILVSNDPYRFTADSRFGSRERMDLGVLGIVAARAGEGDDFPAFAAAWWAGQRDSSGAWLQWEASEFEVRSAGPIPAGVDGEALMFHSPLRLRSLPAPFASVCPPPQGPWAAPQAESDVSRSCTGDETATGRRPGCHRNRQRYAVDRPGSGATREAPCGCARPILPRRHDSSSQACASRSTSSASQGLPPTPRA